MCVCVLFLCFCFLVCLETYSCKVIVLCVLYFMLKVLHCHSSMYGHGLKPHKAYFIILISVAFRMVQSTLESDDTDDDFFIPFDPPLVSKYGPISRHTRIKGRNTAPVNVTAEDVSGYCPLGNACH